MVVPSFVGTGTQIVFFVIASPVWVFGVLLFILWRGVPALRGSDDPVAGGDVVQSLQRTFEPLSPGRRRLGGFWLLLLVVATVVMGRVSSVERATSWHVAAVVVVGTGVLTFEHLKPFRGGSTAIGVVAGHRTVRDSDGVTRYEAIEFVVDRETTTFEVIGPSQRRAIGTQVVVSYRPESPGSAREISEASPGISLLLVGVGAVGGFVFLGWTILPVLAVIGGAYADYVRRDRSFADRDRRSIGAG